MSSSPPTLKRAFEDFAPGEETPLADRLLSDAEIASFDQAYGAPGARADGAAGPWHVTALFMRMLFDGSLRDSLCLGSPGAERIDWPEPARAGDRLSGVSTVLDCRPLRSRPTMGIVRSRHRVTNQHGTVVLSIDLSALLSRRVPGPAEANSGDKPPSPAAPADDEAAVLLGTHRFSAEEITRFAAAYDPQAFHLDPAAAAATHFGALCASGWHTAAVHRRLRERHSATGDRQAGGSGHLAGARDLRWLRPVFAGDTLACYSGGASQARHWATNQAGETVFSYLSA